MTARALALATAQFAALALFTVSLSHRWQISTADAWIIVMFVFGCSSAVVIPILLARK